MKSLIISIILFSLLLGGIITNAVYVSSVCEELASSAQELSSSSEREALIEDMRETWHKRRDLLDLGIRTGELEHMNDLIEGLYAAHSAQNEAEFQKYCILISELANEFASHEKISFKSLC